MVQWCEHIYLFSLALQPRAGYGLPWLCSPAWAMASCGCAAQCGLWPPVAVQPSAGYGLLWLCSPVWAMASLFRRFRDHTWHATVGLRRSSMATCILWSWVWIPLVAWMFFFVCVLCCLVEVSGTGWSLIQSSPTDCGMLYVITKTTWTRRP
jgi:hypothetical protein